MSTVFWAPACGECQLYLDTVASYVLVANVVIIHFYVVVAGLPQPSGKKDQSLSSIQLMKNYEYCSIIRGYLAGERSAMSFRCFDECSFHVCSVGLQSIVERDRDRPSRKQASNKTQHRSRSETKEDIYEAKE